MLNLDVEITEITTSASLAIDVIEIDIGEAISDTAIFEDQVEIDLKEFVTIFSISRFDLGSSEYAIYDVIGVDTIHDSYDKQAVLDSNGKAIIWPLN